MAADLAMIGQQVADKVQGIPVQSLKRVVYGLLGAWLLYVVVQLVMLLIPESVDLNEPVTEDQNPAVVASSSQVDIGRLRSFNLFGQLGEQPIVVENVQPVAFEEDVDAVKTKLNIELQGIISASETHSAVAIIVHKGAQEQYHIGDKLPVGSQVTLAKVLLDHVIIDNKGQYESLWLYDDSDLATTSNKAPRQNNRAIPRPASMNKQVQDMRNNTQATSLAKDYRKRLYKNPKSLAEVLRIAPAQQDGEMVGYRVSPGRDREQFKELGFMANDVVTSINDIELDEPSQALEVYKLMRTATEASFTVLRNGESIQLMVALGESGE